MASKDLKYFMRKREEKYVTAPAPESFVDENGETLEMRIKVLSYPEYKAIQDGYKTRKVAKNDKGAPFIGNNHTILWAEDNDSETALNHLIVESLQYPNLKDKELMDFYGCYEYNQMPMLVFPDQEDYNYVGRVILEAHGLGVSDSDDLKIKEESSDELIKDAKNS